MAREARQLADQESAAAERNRYEDDEDWTDVFYFTDS
jgi:hypothetical protein